MKERTAVASIDPMTEPTTVRPPFDPEAYARETDSIANVEQHGVAPSVRPTTPPPPGMPGCGAIDVDCVPLLALAREDMEWFDVTALARVLLDHVDGIGTVGAFVLAGERPNAGRHHRPARARARRPHRLALTADSVKDAVFE